MSELVARTGRHQQRYENGCRLIAGYDFVSLHKWNMFFFLVFKLDWIFDWLCRKIGG